MTRLVKNWKAVKVEEMQVAPHRYTWDDDDTSIDVNEKLSVWKAKVPYKEGEVVFVEHNGEAKRALIYIMRPERDRAGFRQEVYLCQIETADGHFAKQWTKVWPGGIQRGYFKAGRAPDLEGKL